MSAPQPDPKSQPLLPNGELEGRISANDLEGNLSVGGCAEKRINDGEKIMTSAKHTQQDEQPKRSTPFVLLIAFIFITSACLRSINIKYLMVDRFPYPFIMQFSCNLFMTVCVSLLRLFVPGW